MSLLRIMHKDKGGFLRSIQAFIGAVIGVGIFGLPYVFGQAGVAIGLIHIIVIGLVNFILLATYADIVMNIPGHRRLTGIVDTFLGRHWGLFATVLFFASTWGAMIAYIIIGGEFLEILLQPLVALSITGAQLLFFLVSAILLIGGLGFISRIQGVFIALLLLAVVVIAIGAVPHVEIDHLQYINHAHWFAPFGVVLFAFGGLAVIPEMADMLGPKNRHKLRRAIGIGMGVVGLIYTVFASVIVGVTGDATTSDAIVGLGPVVGDWVLYLGAAIGLIAVFTSFLILGISLMDTLVYDYKQRYMLSWAIVVAVPLIVFLLGARDFIDVIGFTGAVLVGLLGLVMLYTYVKAKAHICAPKRCLAIPHWLLWICGLVFTFGIIATIVG